ncbi:hypothetical protein KY345_06250, partial [Candidatus Woesearchaeota archaeon]|nr:hypothetical protein [Candidatus Woesearchaeota archaeon]
GHTVEKGDGIDFHTIPFNAEIYSNIGAGNIKDHNTIWGYDQRKNKTYHVDFKNKSEFEIRTWHGNLFPLLYPVDVEFFQKSIKWFETDFVITLADCDHKKEHPDILEIVFEGKITNRFLESPFLLRKLPFYDLVEATEKIDFLINKMRYAKANEKSSVRPPIPSYLEYGCSYCIHTSRTGRKKPCEDYILKK